MLFKIHKHALTVEDSLGYNGRKVESSVATVVAVGNMKNAHALTIEDTFSQYESIRTRSNVKNKGYHISINPAEGEALSDAKAARIATELMEKMGFGQQPWALFKHFDIDRVHYHIVTTRVKNDGHLVDDSNEKYRITAIGRELAAKYGYVYGKGREKREILCERFSPGKEASGQIRHLVTKALQYHFRSTEEFAEILRSMGIGTGLSYDRRSGVDRLVFRGLGPDGKPCTRYIFNIDDINPKESRYGLLVLAEEIARNNRDKRPSLTAQQRTRLSKLVTRAIAAADGKKDPQQTFLRFMENSGVPARIKRNAHTHEIEDVTIIDDDTRQVLHLEEVAPWITHASLGAILPWSAPAAKETKRRGRRPSIREAVAEELRSAFSAVAAVIERNTAPLREKLDEQHKL